MKRLRNRRSILTYRFTSENHNLTDDEIKDVEDLLLGMEASPSGFYVVLPIKNPDSVESIIESYYPLLSLNDTTLSIWLSFNRFIAPLDEVTDNKLINENVMRFDVLCPEGFMKEPFKEDRILGYGQCKHIFNKGFFAFSLNNSKMKSKIERYKIKDATEIVEILSHCVYLFFFASSGVYSQFEVYLESQWKTHSFHEHFVVYILYGFIAHHPSFGFKTSMEVWAKFLKIENESIFLDTIETTKKENVVEFIYHYCQYLDEYGNDESSALYYAVSMIRVNRYNL